MISFASEQRRWIRSTSPTTWPGVMPGGCDECGEMKRYSAIGFSYRVVVNLSSEMLIVISRKLTVLESSENSHSKHPVLTVVVNSFHWASLACWLSLSGTQIPKMSSKYHTKIGSNSWNLGMILSLSSRP